jgi:hypothetical protein
MDHDIRTDHDIRVENRPGRHAVHEAADIAWRHPATSESCDKILRER